MELITTVVEAHVSIRQTHYEGYPFNRMMSKTLDVTFIHVLERIQTFIRLEVKFGGWLVLIAAVTVTDTKPFTQL